MSSVPMIHLLDWKTAHASLRYMPKPAYTIMARPLAHQRGWGTVSALVPAADMVLGVRSGNIEWSDYAAAYQTRLEAALGALGPGQLTAITPDGPVVVPNDAVLCCACSPLQAHLGRCHRVYAAFALRVAGWDVELDGNRIA